MSFSLIILAAGNSSRFRSYIPKPYHKIGGKTLIEINLLKINKIKEIKKIIVVYNGNDAKKIKNLNLTNIKLILGGNNRQASTFNALKYLIKNNTTSKVLIHDAARPNFSLKLLRSIVDKSKKYQDISNKNMHTNKRPCNGLIKK